MRIGINGHLLSFEPTYRQAGVSRYIEALIRYFPDVAPDDDLVVFTGPARPPAGAEAGQGIVWKHCRLPTEKPPVRIVWEQVVSPVATRRAGVDIMHFPVNVVTALPGVPQVVTVHDLAFHHYPEQYPGMKRRYLTAMTRFSVRRASGVIAVSEATRQDILSAYGCDPDKVVVIPNGVDEEMHTLPDQDVAAFRQTHALPAHFLLFLGTLQPRKNLETLLKAYARVANHVDWPLVVAGARGWQYEEIFKRVRHLGLSERVRFVGHVPGEELALWYNAATVFIYPSLYEGFGLPALEAMACGTPVIASNTSALPEVVGDCGVLVDPLDVDALAGSILHLAGNAEVRQQLGQRGQQRAAGFTWRRTVEQTVEVYRQV